jgi:hypothetical protein
MQQTKRGDTLSILLHSLSEHMEIVASFGVSYVAVKGVEVDY